MSHLQCGGEATRWQGEEPAAGINREDAGTGRAYAWAQQLGGLQGLPHLESTSDVIASTSKSCTSTEPFGFIDDWFGALSRRLEARMSLNAEARFEIFVEIVRSDSIPNFSLLNFRSMPSKAAC